MQTNVTLSSGSGTLTDEMPKYLAALSKGPVIKDLYQLQPVQVQRPALQGIQHQSMDMILLLSWCVVTKDEPK